MARRVTVVAGAGALVPIVVRAAIAAGDAVQVVALGDVPAGLDGAELVRADLSQPQTMMLALRTFGATHVVLAGAVSLSDRNRQDLAAFLAPGATDAPVGDAALSGLGQAIRKITGAELVGAHEIATELVAEPGHLAGPRADDGMLASGRLAFEAARHVGRLDLGQAAVVSGARVIAVEDVAGTDELLARAGRYRQAGLVGDGSTRLVLAKTSKPQQPTFVDLPAIGPRTVEQAAAAGIALIVVEAGRTLLLERSALYIAANAAAVTLHGLEAI